MKLTQKYQALLHEAQRRELPNLATIQLCFQTLTLANTIDKDCAALLAPHGLSEARFILLFLLDAAPEGLAAKTLAAQAGITRATVTGLLDGLEQAGLVRRHTDLADRRTLTLRLTTQGKQLASTLFTQHSHWIAGLFSGLTASEQQQLSYLLNKVGTPLQEAQT